MTLVNGLHGLGWNPQLPDHRDYKLDALPLALTIPLPESVDLRPQINWMYDQGKENSCTAHCSMSLNRFVRRMNKQPDLDGSRAFEYWNTRNIEGHTLKDSGAYLRDAMKVIVNTGVVPEESWGYTPSTLYATPPQALYTTAALNKAASYHVVDQSRDGLQGCLASGYPFVLGIEVFTAFESAQVARTGIVPNPTSGDKVLGGHAILCVGYDNAKQWYIIMNSWGSGWGDHGYFYLTYDYVESELADDFWCLQ